MRFGNDTETFVIVSTHFSCQQRENVTKPGAAKLHKFRFRIALLKAGCEKYSCSENGLVLHGDRMFYVHKCQKLIPSYKL